MTAILLLLAIAFAVAASMMLSHAARRAIAHKSTVWSVARLEGGGAAIFMLMALITAAVAGGWL